MAMLALLMGVESIQRLMLPLPIRLNETISVATIGLVVNVISAWLPRGGQLAGLSDRGECIDNRLHNH